MLRWLPTAFNKLKPPGLSQHIYPPSYRSDIDKLTPFIQSDINAGVYKAGFARTQEDYEKAVIPLFAALNHVEALIKQNGGPYVLGEALTELDIRLYATIVRFDTVYVQHFKTNLGTIRHDYPVLNNWLKNLYWNVSGFRETTDFKHIKENVSYLVDTNRLCKTDGSLVHEESL